MKFWEGKRASEAEAKTEIKDQFEREAAAYQRLAEMREKRRAEALERYPIGTVVRLLSGGPDMTIADYDERDYAHRVVWADATGIIHTRTIGEKVFQRVGLATPDT